MIEFLIFFGGVFVWALIEYSKLEYKEYKMRAVLRARAASRRKMNGERSERSA